LRSGLSMVVEVLYSPAVLRDLDAIWEWIAIEKE
jgi:plasmid stabilization system protein ParE